MIFHVKNYNNVKLKKVMYEKEFILLCLCNRFCFHN